MPRENEDMSFNFLIVDDSEVMRKVIKRVVKLAGVDIGELLEAENGKEALSVLDEYWIDIVFSDLNMPEMDGFELIQSMRMDSTMASIPVVVISTEARQNKIDEIMEAGADGFLTKPFKPEDIRNIICETLGVEIDERFTEESEGSDF